LDVHSTNNELEVVRNDDIITLFVRLVWGQFFAFRSDSHSVRSNPPFIPLGSL